MKKILMMLLLVCLMPVAHAMLSMELTRGVSGAIPISIIPFTGSDNAPQNVSGIIANDLQNSGRFKVSARELGDNVVKGQVKDLGSDRYQVSFELLDNLRGKGQESVALSKSFTISGRELRAVAHHISDMIYQHMTGTRGVFSTKIAYVVVQRAPGQSRYVLEVSDQDGYNPRPMLTSSEPIMSPSWSPNGRQIAYVSFEGRKANIIIQDVASGNRRVLSSFPGINGAPSWSPDGRKLALVLSKSGSPNIYVMDVSGGGLKQVTNDFYINTEPSWSPDGRTLLFTSNRGGGPQIYQVSANGGSPTRVSYDGKYNARGSFASDGRHVAMIHRTSGNYNIAILDLDAGTTRVLTPSNGDSSSPSIAPNGSMILYDTIYNGRNVLGMVSSDGGVQLVLPARAGDAQDPAWSPFLG